MIHCFEVNDKYLTVNWFYKQESEDWHKKVHKNGGEKRENVLSTLNTISEGSVMYGLNVDNELAAFFVRYEDENGIALEGFHIAKKFRNSFFLKEFWKIVKEKLGDDIWVGIYENNESAINHLKSQGFMVETKKVIEDKSYFILHLKL